jgi:Spy/CpxP family protein refolding chaperone
MRAQTLRTMCLCAGLFLPAVASVLSQAPPPPPPGSPGGPGGGMPGPGGPGGPRPGSPNPANNNRTTATPAHNALQFGPVGRWWDDRSVVQQIGLSKEQQKTMDSIFNANKPAILESYKTFLSAQANLEHVNKDPSADKTKVFQAIDAVNEARTNLQKATSAMLLQIRQQMTSDQIEKLQKLP